MKKLLLASVAMVAPVAFMSETCETVLIKGKDGKPVRVNKSDYDADQAEGGAKEMTLFKGGDDADQAVTGEPVKTFDQLGMQPVAAPSAPDFSGGGETSSLPVDPRKEAAAPVAPSPNQRLVSKEGTGKNTKYFVVDGTGAKIEMDGVNKDGYATEKEAWDAIMALPH